MTAPISRRYIDPCRYYIVNGAGVLVTGGVITDVRAPPPGRNPSPRGDKIEDGVSSRGSASDMIIIRGKTPHWWSARKLSTT